MHHVLVGRVLTIERAHVDDRRALPEAVHAPVALVDSVRVVRHVEVDDHARGHLEVEALTDHVGRQQHRARRRGELLEALVALGLGQVAAQRDDLVVRPARELLFQIRQCVLEPREDDDACGRLTARFSQQVGDDGVAEGGQLAVLGGLDRPQVLEQVLKILMLEPLLDTEKRVVRLPIPLVLRLRVRAPLVSE